jgi:eukaryotic-like serine/threonine-protein kinase
MEHPLADAPLGLPSVFAGRYTILREIGRGGMATVYLARDLERDTDVALKVLSPDLAPLLGAERFAREIRIISGLQPLTFSPCSTPVVPRGTPST